MELIFEHVQKVVDGRTPAAYHSPDNVVQVFYTDDTGRLWATQADTPLGNFADLTFGGDMLAAPGTAIRDLALSYLPRVNLWATWRQGGAHKMAVFLLKQETNRYLTDGDLSFAEDDSGVTLNLTLENPAGIIAAEDATEVPPGTRINIFFTMGDSSRVSLGIYYLDRIVTAVGDPQVQITARNATGKLLKDQTFDENNTFAKDDLDKVLAAILDVAGVVGYRIEDSSEQLGAEFPHDMTIYDGLMALISTQEGWQLKEDHAGKIIIGGPAFTNRYLPPGVYTFERGRDCIGREVTRDDRETYSRVCVHTPDFAVKAWRDVSFLSGWNLPRQKTLYVEAPEGTKQAKANSLAAALASRLATVGVVEAFVAPFRPQLQPGDRADIIESGTQARTLGTITQVGLQFGKGGFMTDFTVDSGGMLKKPRLKDLIDEIGGKRDVGSAKITD